MLCPHIHTTDTSGRQGTHPHLCVPCRRLAAPTRTTTPVWGGGALWVRFLLYLWPLPSPLGGQQACGCLVQPPLAGLYAV